MGRHRRPGWRRAGVSAVALAALALLVLVAWPGAPRHGGSEVGAEPLLVGLKAGASQSDVSGALAARGAHVTARIEQINALVVQPRAGDGAALLNSLKRHAAVEYAQRDEAIWHTAAVPTDPLYSGGNQWNIDRVKAPDAWDLLPPGGNTIVGIIDTGIDYNHPEFAGRISPAGCDMFHKRCSRETGLSPARDDEGHGTHVAGIIGAATNNGTGIASVSGGRVTLLPVKVLSQGGGAASTSDIIAGITYAADNGAKVINMSISSECGSQRDEAWAAALAYLEQRGVLLVVSAGNQGGCREGRYPHSDPRVLSVAATDIADNAPEFTNVGQYVSVAAPGVNILSTFLSSLAPYARASGTSQAAPHVTAQAALLFQVPGATKTQVMQWITSTCDSANVSSQCGGRINVYRSVYLATKGVDPGKGSPAPAAPAPPPAPGATAPATPPPPAPAPAAPAPPAPLATRPAPPPPPADFTLSDVTLTAEAPAAPAGNAANVGWNGRFWPTAPQVAVGVCGIDEESVRDAVETALRLWSDASAQAGWRMIRNDDACDPAFAGPRMLITVDAIDPSAPIAVISDVALDGSPCGAGDRTACWLNSVTVTIGATAFAAADAGRPVDLLRAVGQALGLGRALTCDNSVMLPGCAVADPAAGPGTDDIASLRDLLAMTLQALRAPRP